MTAPSNAANWTIADINNLNPWTIEALTASEIQAIPLPAIAAADAAFWAFLSDGQFAELTSAQVATLTPVELAALRGTEVAGLDIHALTGGQIANLTSAFADQLTASQLNAMSKDQFEHLSSGVVGALTAETLNNLRLGLVQTIDVRSLSMAVLESLSLSCMNRFTTAQVESFSAPQIAVLDAAQISKLLSKGPLFTPSQLAARTASQLASLPPIAVAGLTAGDILAMSPSEIADFAPTALSLLTEDAVKALSTAQVAALSVQQLKSLTQRQLQVMTLNEIASIPQEELHYVIASLSGIQVATEISTSAESLKASEISQLTVEFVRYLTPQQIAVLPQLLFRALTGPNLDALTSADWSTIHPGEISATIVAKLGVTAIEALSPEDFAALIGPWVKYLSTSAVGAISVADLSALSAPQLQAFTSAEILAMSSTQAAEVFSADPLSGRVRAQESDGQLTYSGALSVLDGIVVGGMTTRKLAELDALSRCLAPRGSISATPYVTQIFNDVVQGNTANAFWNGGASTPSPLGDLSATSTQAQAEQLIDKWFLGGDLPSFDVDSVGGNTPFTYEAVSLPLFGNGGPSLYDISQGQTGDCYFDAALGAVALQDPAAIENMIAANGNGTWAVEFQVNGSSDYVTVDDALPVYANGQLAFTSGGETLWAPLIEKAYVQLVEQTAVTPGADLDVNGDSYADISGGYGQAITEITGQQVNELDASSYPATTGPNSITSLLAASLGAGQEVLLASEADDYANSLVAGHMFIVTGADPRNGAVSLRNPWGAHGASTGLQMSFTVPASTLLSEGDYFYASSGKPVI